MNKRANSIEVFYARIRGSGSGVRTESRLRPRIPQLGGRESVVIQPPRFDPIQIADDMGHDSLTNNMTQASEPHSKNINMLFKSSHHNFGT
jgi:hypothetical protein